MGRNITQDNHAFTILEAKIDLMESEISGLKMSGASNGCTESEQSVGSLTAGQFQSIIHSCFEPLKKDISATMERLTCLEIELQGKILGIQYRLQQRGGVINQ